MKKNKLKFILLILFMPLLSYCSDVKDALQGKKRSEQSDEFLVKKKNPLQMPPDMNKLPTPGDNLEINSSEKKDDVKELLQIKENKNNKNSDGKSDLLNNMKKKIQ
tara:strand:+ start:367 stop:684 length:318 start_codon:yes stop_codon:yes gene_type:complete